MLAAPQQKAINALIYLQQHGISETYLVEMKNRVEMSENLRNNIGGSNNGNGSITDNYLNKMGYDSSRYSGYYNGYQQQVNNNNNGLQNNEQLYTQLQAQLQLQSELKARLKEEQSQPQQHSTKDFKLDLELSKTDNSPSIAETQQPINENKTESTKAK